MKIKYSFDDLCRTLARTTGYSYEWTSDQIAMDDYLINTGGNYPFIAPTHWINEWKKRNPFSAVPKTKLTHLYHAYTDLLCLCPGLVKK